MANQQHETRDVGLILAVVLLMLMVTVAMVRGQSVTAVAAGQVGRATVRVVQPPTFSLFVEPMDQSPHFNHARYTYTDFCYCWTDPSSRARAARRFDLIMSGDLESWKVLNPTSDRLPYTLVQTVFTDEPDTTKAHKVDPNSLSGKYQDDARAWYAKHPEYDYEKLYLHNPNQPQPDSASRLHFIIWNNYRYAINPFDPGARAYTIDRLRRLRASRPAGTGLFFDEMDHNAWSWPGKSLEGAGMDSTSWHKVVVSFVKEIHDSLGVMTQTNAAEYSDKLFDRQIGVAAGAMHLERMWKATAEMTKTWNFVDSLTNLGVYVDLVSLESFDDFKRYGPNFFPKGNYDDAVGRGKVYQLAGYYMVTDSLHKLVGLQTDNTRGYPPDSVWLKVYELNVGYPKARRYVWQSGTDALGQTATIYRRDFTNAVVLVRPITSYKYPTMTDTTAVKVSLPEGGPWSYVKARGQVVPLDSLKLRNSEAVILIKRPQ